MDTRNREMVVYIADKGQGKSTLAMIHMKKFLTKHAEKGLILVNADNPANRPYKWLRTLEDLNGFCKNGKGIVKVNAVDFNMDEVEMLTYLSTRYRNGVLNIEDASAYLGGSLPRSVKNWLTNHKNFGVELQVIYHGLFMLSPLVRSFAHKLMLFRTKENFNKKSQVNRLERAYPSCSDEILAAWKALQKHKPTKEYVQPYVIIDTGI